MKTKSDRAQNKNSKQNKVSLQETIRFPDGARDTFSGAVSMRMMNPVPRAKRDAPRKPLVSQATSKVRSHAPTPRPITKAPQRMAPPWHSRFTSNVNDVASDSSPIRIIDGYAAGKDFVKGLGDPWAAPGGTMRVVDPWTSLPTESYKYTNSMNLPIANGTTAADGSTAMMIRGDTLQTLYVPAGIDAAHAITWAGGAGYSTYAPYTSGYYNRPVCTMVRIRVLQTGDAHVVTVCSYRVLPATIATQIGVGPASTNVGVTAALREAYQGSEIDLPHSCTLDVVCHASRATTDYFNFTTTGSDRTIYGFAGGFVWLFGLLSTDRVEVQYGAHTEFMPITSAQPLLGGLGMVQATSGSADLSIGAADALTFTAKDIIVNTPGKDKTSVSTAMDKAANVIAKRSTLDTVETGVNIVTDIVAGNWLGAAKNTWDLAKHWIWGSALYRPLLVPTPKGFVLIDPILPRAQHLLPIELRSYASKHKNSPFLAEEEKKEEILINNSDKKEIQVSKTVKVDKTENKDDDEPVMLTPKGARRPSLATMTIGARLR